MDRTTVMASTNAMSVTRTTITTAYAVVKRAAESSASSTSSGKDAKCTSKTSCQKPTNTNAVTVGVAVAIPVGCVLILFVVILWVVYRRNKKEAQEDHDPDFEGDTEYLPTKGNGYSLSSRSQSGDSQMQKEWTGDEESYLPRHMGRQFLAKESSRVSQARNVDPFFLPEANENSLRDFARQLQNEELGPYRIASNSNSRIASQVSLTHEKYDARVSQNIGSSMTAYTSTDVNQTSNDSTPTVISSSSDPPLNQSPVKSAVGEVTRKYAEDLSGLEAEQSRLESTFDNQNSQSKPTEISRDTFNFEMGNVLNQLDESLNSAKVDAKHDDDKVISISEKEEEDIKRMKSIYKVYLDRNGTVKQQTLDDSDLRDDEDEQEAVAQSSTLSQAETGTHLRAPSESQRVASSIYSVAPSQSYPVREQPPNPEQYYPEYDNSDAQYQNQPQDMAAYGYAQPYNYQNPATQQYPMQQHPMQQYPPQHYLQFPHQQQYAHPQMLENIDELPTPTNLPFSTSSHSLTSFKQKSKQPQIAQLQAARINGTAVNPMDHPEMFYSQGNDSYSSYHSMNSSGAQPAAPYQLRQSVVMTNPSELAVAPRFRPAGSIRTASATNTRNNTMTSRMNPYYQQQQAYNSRVSGLLNEEDVLQPPSVGQILPHSGSHDDLRRQIGSSHNYNVA